MAQEWTPADVREYHTALAEKAIDASQRTGVDVKITASHPLGRTLTVELSGGRPRMGTAQWIPGPSSD